MVQCQHSLNRTIDIGAPSVPAAQGLSLELGTVGSPQSSSVLVARLRGGQAFSSWAVRTFGEYIGPLKRIFGCPLESNSSK